MSRPGQIEKVRSWLSDQHRRCAAWLVSDYYERFRGARFDALARRSPAGMITRDDLDAVRALSIGFPHAFIDRLERPDVQDRIQQMLSLIPAELALENLSRVEFDELLGPKSHAWKAWEYLALALKEDGARAHLVGASKLLSAKRPLLIPLEDSYVRRTFGCPRRDIWQAIFDTVTDPQVSEGLTWIRRQMPRGNAIAPHRILDVIAWRKQQGHHCC
jgi:hypothetical protein